MEQVPLYPNSPERGQTPSTAAPRTPSSCSLPNLPAPKEEGMAVIFKSLCASKHLRLTAVSGWYLTDHGTSESASREPTHVCQVPHDYHIMKTGLEKMGGLEICISSGIHVRTPNFYHVRFWYKCAHLSYTSAE